MNSTDMVETGETKPQARGLTETMWTTIAPLPGLGSRVRVPPRQGRAERRASIGQSNHSDRVGPGQRPRPTLFESGHS
jgi:hypothetical protein